MEYVETTCEFANNAIVQLVAFNILIAFIIWRNMDGSDSGGGDAAPAAEQG